MAFADFKTEFLGLVAGVTGTFPSGGAERQTLFTDIETAGISIVGYMDDGDRGDEGRPAPRYAAVEIGRTTHDTQWGVRGKTYRAPVTVALLDLAANSTQDQVRTVLETLATQIDDGFSFTNFQSPPERGEIDSSAQNVVFRAISLESKGGIVAATLTYQPGMILTL